MTSGRVARKWRWAVPLACAGLVTGAVLAPGVAAGSGHPSLPTLTPAQLLADLATAKPQPLSGTVVETARLGLPELPSDGRTAASLNAVTFLTGSHTMQLWLGSATQQRFALLAPLSESDIIRSGTQLWIYRSTTNDVTHYDLSAALAAARTKAPTDVTATIEPIPDPLTAAARLLAAVDPTTTVRIDSTEWVAGRPAYQLVLTPRDNRTLVGRITIAVDSVTHLPLRVQVFTRHGGAPAFETGFTALRLGAPAASIFGFRPPAGATVTTGRLPATQPSVTGAPSLPTTAATPQVLGSGWSSVLVLRGVSLPTSSSSATANQLLDLVNRAADRVAGGRVLSTSLFSIMLTDDGRLLIGSVSPATLQRLAAGAAG